MVPIRRQIIRTSARWVVSDLHIMVETHHQAVAIHCLHVGTGVILVMLLGIESTTASTYNLDNDHSITDAFLRKQLEWTVIPLEEYISSVRTLVISTKQITWTVKSLRVGLMSNKWFSVTVTRIIRRITETGKCFSRTATRIMRWIIQTGRWFSEKTNKKRGNTYSIINQEKRYKGLTRLDNFKDQGASFWGLKVSHRTLIKMQERIFRWKH